MAGGSANDPVIVSTWAEFVSALTSYNQYIKWADSENKVIDYVNISAAINCNCTQVDFNGWTINRLDISDIQGYYVFNRNNNYGIATIMNLTINRLNVFNTARACVHIFSQIVYCYFWDIYYQAHETIYTNNQYYEFDFKTGASAYIGQIAYNSVIKMRSEDYAPRVPLLSAYNSEIEIDYKWTKSDTDDYSLFWGIPHTNTSPFQVGLYRHCYISGKIDISEGSGVWHMTCQNFSYRGYLKTDDTIVNIQVISGGDCTLDRWYFNCDNPNDCLMVINNGNSMTMLNNIVASAGAVEEITFKGTKTLKEDLKNKDWLNDLNFNFIDDDDFRYPQYVPDFSFNNYEYWVWRKSNYVNSSVPFLPFYFYPVVEPPVYRGDVYEAEYICIYDLATPQNGFTGHGLAILRPTSCRVVEELNGSYNLTLVHPKDNEGRWQYILEMNIIKCMGQLFVIQRVDEVLSGGSYSVTAYAEHISYTLNDRWIFPPVTIAGYHGSTLMASILEQSTDMGGDWQTQYTFTVSSDIDAPEDFRDWYEMPDGVTPYEMLLGSNGFIAKLGGELYRDNFTLKINERMYGAEDKAFELAIGYNLTGIKRTVDLTTFVTYLRCYDVSNDDYGTWWAVSWDPSTLPRAYPRNVVRSKNFTYDHEEYKEGQLERDGNAFWNQNCAPLISYELNVVDLKRSPDYKDFVNNYRFRVGDKGRVWDERLQAWTEVEITRTEKDGITGETTKVIIGSQRSFTRPNSYNPITPINIDADKTLEGYTPLTFISDGNTLKHLIVYGESGGVGNTITITTPSPTTTHYDTETGAADSETGYYSCGAVSVSASWTYTTSVGEQLVFEVLYYDNSNTFLSYETSTSAVASYTFTVPSGASYAIIQVASNDTVSKFSLSTICLTIVVAGYDSQTILKPLSAPIGEGQSVDYTDIPSYSGENTLTIDTTVSPRVKIQYREPVDHDINKTIEGVPPLTFRSNGDNLANWIIYGNTGGVGTVGTNLFNSSLGHDKYNNSGQKIGTSDDYISSNELVPCESNVSYNVSVHSLYRSSESLSVTIFEYDNQGNYVKDYSQSVFVSYSDRVNGRITFTTTATTAYLRFQIDVTGKTSKYTLETITDFMLYTGTAKKEYEPYSSAINVVVASGGQSQTISIPITAKLELGQTISLQTSGVDIPTYSGVNTLTVTSDIQPEKVKIQYKEPI